MSNELTQWHSAFCSAIKLELVDYKNDLDYLSELGLNSKPILIDLLVITKSEGTSKKNINNEIGNIFKGHNIFEYKSPKDKLNIDTFFKGIAYACLYKTKGESVDEIKANDITLSFVRQAKPTNLFSQLKEFGYKIENKYKGIYYIIGNHFFDIQIIVSKELDKKEHLWLSSLASDIDSVQAKEFILSVSALKNKDEKEYADSVMQVVMRENESVFNNIKEVGIVCDALKDLMKDEITEAKEKGKAEAETEVAKRMIRMGCFSNEEIADATNIPLSEIVKFRGAEQ